MNRRGSAAVLILLVGVIIVLYILFLTPTYREQILASVVFP